jgi:hypothetical protein
MGRRIHAASLAVALLLLSGAARAQVTGAPAAAEPPAPTDAQAMPPPALTETPPPTDLGAPPVAGSLTAAPDRTSNVSYGVAARLRWVSVPAWMLNLFTKKNVPLSSYATALELFRRKGEFDFIVSIGYQNMSPPDGNWLARGHDASIDTDYVQFKGLAMWAVDASFVWHTFFNDWFGMHYGAGIGLGIVTGQMMRTSNYGCTEANAGDFTVCKPMNITCTAAGCPDAALQRIQGTADQDSPTTPRRFVDGNVPPALPIVNVLVGIDFRLPRVRGWEAKIEGGFYDAFFLGGGVGYTF